MKQLLICLSLFFSLAAYSQDIIIFNSGDTLECKIQGVNYAGIHTKTDEGSKIFKNDLVQAYNYRNIWVQVAGPTANNAAAPIDLMALNQLQAQRNFEQSLNGAGSWLIAGVVISTLMIGGGILMEDEGLPLLIGGAVVLPLSLIVAGGKLKKASRQHKMIEFK